MNITITTRTIYIAAWAIYITLGWILTGMSFLVPRAVFLLLMGITGFMYLVILGVEINLSKVLYRVRLGSFSAPKGE